MQHQDSHFIQNAVPILPGLPGRPFDRDSKLAELAVPRIPGKRENVGWLIQLPELAVQFPERFVIGHKATERAPVRNPFR